jgi:hypothetical protein
MVGTSSAMGAWGRIPESSSSPLEDLDRAAVAASLSLKPCWMVLSGVALHTRLFGHEQAVFPVTFSPNIVLSFLLVSPRKIWYRLFFFLFCLKDLSLMDEPVSAVVWSKIQSVGCSPNI